MSSQFNTINKNKYHLTCKTQKTPRFTQRKLQTYIFKKFQLKNIMLHVASFGLLVSISDFNNFNMFNV